MNGKAYFLDTNAIVQLLKGNQYLLNLLQDAEFISCSIISKLEYLAFPNLSNNDINLFKQFSEQIEIMALPSDNDELAQYILDIRQQKQAKLPDAIIVGCCIYKKCILVTADKKLLNIEDVISLSYPVL